MDGATAAGGRSCCNPQSFPFDHRLYPCSGRADGGELDLALPHGFDNIERVAAGRAPLWVGPELNDLLK